MTGAVSGKACIADRPDVPLYLHPHPDQLLAKSLRPKWLELLN